MRSRLLLLSLFLAAFGCTGNAVTSVLVTQEPPGENCPLGGASVVAEGGAPTYVCSGATGATGATGTAGQNAVVTNEPAGANCAAGGVKVQVGSATPSYVCHGAAGADGISVSVVNEAPGANCAQGGVKVQAGSAAPAYVCTGAAGTTGAAGQSVAATPEAPGANCALGGVKLQVGGGAPAYACNGATGSAGLSATVTPEGAGANCASGGVKVQVGPGAPTYVCNGAAGASGAAGQSATVATEPSGANCAAGGVKVQVQSGAPTYVCNGAAGAAGAAGASSTVVPEAPGVHCATGGVSIQVGSGALTYVCNGATGAAGADGLSVVATAEAPGSNCANGGTRFQIGTQPAAYVCNGASGQGGTNGTSCSVVTTISTTLQCTDGTSFVLAQRYLLGGTVSGFVGDFTLLNSGGDAKTLTANGAYAFATGLSTGAAWAVTVGAQPTNATCMLSGASGTIGSGNVTSADVACGCSVGFGNCDGSGANGCEAATTSDTNCGACGVVCGAGTTCTAGACVVPPFTGSTGTISSAPAGETLGNMSFASISGSNGAFFFGGAYFQFYTGTNDYLVKLLLSGAVDTTFGTNGWLRLSTLPNARATHNNHMTHWTVCNGQVYALNRNTGPGQLNLDRLNLTATPGFTQLAVIPNVSGSAITTFSCVEGKVLLAVDMNPSTVKAFMMGADEVLVSGPAEVENGGYLGFTQTGDGALWTYNMRSPTPTLQRLNLASGGATAVLESKPLLSTGGRNIWFEALVHESASRAVMYTRSGTPGRIDVVAGTQATVMDLLTNAATPYAPTISYAPTFLSSIGAAGVSAVGLCSAGGRLLTFASAAPPPTYTPYSFSAFVLNADGTRFSGLNGGNELVFNHAPYNNYQGLYWLTITCDPVSGFGAFAYKDAAGQPTVKLINLAAP